MKNKITYLIFSIVLIIGLLAYWNFSPTSSVGEQSIFGGSKAGLTELQKDIIIKFREGDVPGLVEYLDEEVSISMMEETDYYLKGEAANVLLEFCRNHTAKKFLVKHYGINQTKTSYYLIAELLTINKEKYRVYISNNKTHIENIEISKPRDI